MKGNTFLFQSLGNILGTEPGSGMSFILITAGLIFGLILPLAMFLIPSVKLQDKERNQKETQEIKAIHAKAYIKRIKAHS
ncbi:hypothetical protein [Neobacillus terrae]|uniref:hypothetical protein n=1 Tax=Neobacillus terrae TaxID=3034837 RepID=UPI001409AF60|nr:hypothetical protein [Neobacillus terrae]NHM33893.1 hypothetical protein [Neobacillus terrae]